MAEALAAGCNVFGGTWVGGSAAEAIEIRIDWFRQICRFPDGCKGFVRQRRYHGQPYALGGWTSRDFDGEFKNAAVVYL